MQQKKDTLTGCLEVGSIFKMAFDVFHLLYEWFDVPTCKKEL